MRKVLAALLLLTSPVTARADAPVIWSGSYVKWLASGLRAAGLMKTDAAGQMTPYITDGLVKMSSGVPGAAVSGTDFAPATSGSGYQKGNGSGGFTNQAVPIPYADGGTNATTAWTQGSVIFAGASGFAQDNTNFFWDATNHRLGLGTASPASSITIKNGPDDNVHGIRFLPTSGSEFFDLYTSGTSTLQLRDPFQNVGLWQVNNQGRMAVAGASIGHPDATFLNENQPGVTGIPTYAAKKQTSQTADFLDFYDTDETTILFGVSIAGKMSATNIKDSALGAGVVRSDASGNFTSAELSSDVTTSGSNATTVAKIQGTTVSGTTGTTNVVFSTAPTMTNPVVGTQSTGDSSTKAASTAFVQTALAQLNPAAAVKAASTANIPGTYTNAVGGVCIGDTFQVTSTAAFAPDGITLTVGQRFLMKDQTSGFQNGVWTLTTAANVGVLGALLTRALDWDSSADMNAGSLIPVISGTTNANTVWYQTAAITTCNSDSQVYTKFAGSGGGAACSVLTKTADYSISSGDFNSNGCLMIYANCSSKCTMTNIAAAASGKALKVKCAGTAECDVSGTEDGASVYQMTQQYQAAEFDDIGGSEWSIF